MPAAEREPLERGPALGARSRRAVDGDGALERGALRRDGARVVARVGVLLVRRVVLLVDDDQAESPHRREHGRAGADDDARLAARDPHALVAPLGIAERRVQDRDALAEAGAHPPDRLRRERDLRDEDDRAEPALERGGARLQVDLGLAGAGRRRRGAGCRRRRPSPRRSVAPRPAVPARARAARPRRRAPAARPAAPAPCAASATRARRAPAPVPESSRSSRRSRVRAATSAGGTWPITASTGRASTPAGASSTSATTIPRARDRPNGIRTIAPTPTPSSTSYVNSRATARAVTSG